MGEKNKLTGWPDPWAPMDRETAGALAGVSKATIGKIAIAIARGECVPNVRDSRALAVGRLFADEDSGTTSGKVSADLVYRALKIDPETLGGPFIKAEKKPPKGKPRKRNVVPDAASLASMDTETLTKGLAETIHQARAASGGRVPWEKLKAIADTLIARGVRVQAVVHGYPVDRLDLAKCRRFGVLGVFLAHAEPTDLWPFVLPARSRRPVDLFSASADDIMYGQLIGLTLKDWLGLMAAALVDEKRQERSESDAELLFATVQPAAGDAFNSNGASDGTNEPGTSV